MVADVADTLPLAGKKAHPVELPVLSVVIAPVFDVIPDAEGHLEKLIPNLLGVVDAVLLPAELHPPIIHPRIVQIVVSIGEVRFLVHIGPVGRSEGYRMIGLPRLDHTADPHGLPISRDRGDIFAILVSCLPAYTIVRPAHGSEHTVP